MSDKPSESARSFITEAFITLLAMHPFDKITVHEIVRKAGVSRSTFYLHFQDKFDLLDQITNHIVGELSTFYRGKTSGVINNLGTRDWLLRNNEALCKHVQRYNNFYLRRLKDMQFVSYLSELLKNWMYPNLGEDRSIFAAYGTVGVIRSWLENEPLTSIETMAHKLTNIAFYLLPNFGEILKENVGKDLE